MRILPWLAALAACGRVGFDPVSSPPDAGASRGGTTACEPAACAAAGGTCANGTCMFTCVDKVCTADITCPAHMPCTIDCVGVCEGAISCGEASACTIICANADSCAGPITCDPATCELVCTTSC